MMLLLAFFLSPALAAPPSLGFLQSPYIQDAIFHELRYHGGYIVLLNDGSETQHSHTDSVWSIWNDPSVEEYIRESELVLAYLDEPTPDQLIRNHVEPGTGPIVVYKNQLGKQYARLAKGLPRTPKAMIEWLKFPQRYADIQQSTDRKFIESIASDPGSVRHRMHLIEHRKNNGSPRFMIYSLYPWLFEHNEEWFAYSKSYCGVNNEDSFRRLVFNEIHSARLYLDLFVSKRESIVDDELVFERDYDNWIEEQIRLSHAFGQGIQIPPVGVVHQWTHLLDMFSKSCDSTSATERDLFILHALTAEGEDWDALVELYKEDAESYPASDE